MKRILLYAALGTIVLTQAGFPQPSLQSPVPPDSEIRKILEDRIGKKQGTVGIVVGIIEPAGRRIVAFGSSDRNDRRPLDGNSVFEIGSITKVFTSLLLADMVRRGEVALTDPVAKYLPQGVKMPGRGGVQITLEDLARHRSGLPRMPTNFNAGTDPNNPYAGYSTKQLYEFLSSYELTRDIGAQFEYSNMGAGLLGHVLSLAAGKNYEMLIRSRVLQPLGMNSTGISLSSDMKSRLAVGHNGSFEATSNWDLTDAFAGAGALRSTASDMLSFLAAQLGEKQSDLGPAIAATTATRKPAGSGMEIGLGWLIRAKKESEIIWHNGGTGGYRTFAGYDPKARTGVVVLSNVSTAAGPDDIGFHLLDPESSVLPPNSPLVQPPWESRAITLDSTILDTYVGKYRLTSIGAFAVTREGSQLYVQPEGQPRLPFFAESEKEFFCKTEDAQITFESDGKGPAKALILHQGGKDFHATRVAE
jgi:serine-type D-Ala-D-Ala carboxypeptidase/endopeptidase